MYFLKYDNVVLMGSQIVSMEANNKIIYVNMAQGDIIHFNVKDKDVAKKVVAEILNRMAEIESAVASRVFNMPEMKNGWATITMPTFNKESFIIDVDKIIERMDKT